MKNKIVMDSAGDLQSLEGVDFASVPMKIVAEDREFVDSPGTDVSEMIRYLGSYRGKTSTACPGVGEYLEAFEDAENIYCVTITSGLSGSYNSACAAMELLLEKEADKKIYVIDSLTTGAESILILRKLCELIESGLDFDTVIAETEAFKKTGRTVFALCCFDNLVKNGRMSKLKGFVANTLGFWGIGIASEVGTIKMKGVARGQKKAIAGIIDDMRQRSGTVRELILDHCINEDFARQVEAAAREQWPEINVTVLPTRGLCGYYAEKGGLIIGYR